MGVTFLKLKDLHPPFDILTPFFVKLYRFIANYRGNADHSVRAI
jgi:hypothetical protein